MAFCMFLTMAKPYPFLTKETFFRNICMETKSEQAWTTVIKPKNKLFEINLKEILDYRDLLFLFVKRNIITQYKQTVLGPLWFFIQPAFTVIMYMVVFGGIAGKITQP